MKNILIVGGAGYIGSHVVKLLRKKGYTPIILDNLSTGHKQAVRLAIENGQFYEGSYGDAEVVRRIIRKHKVQGVMHFGAKALVGESVENPSLYYQSNVADTLHLLKSLLEESIKYFIFSSSCAVFGVHDGASINEVAPKNPINPYGKTKFMVEQILQDFGTAYGLKSGILRYFNAAGADPDGELGEDHDPETHLIPNILKVALGINPKLIINGENYPTTDGSCVRDYIHVNDLAEAHIKTLNFIYKENSGCNFNLGTGKGYSILETVDAASQLCGQKIPFEFASRRPGDPASLVADSSKIESTLNWKAEFSFKQILETAYAWMQDHPQGYDTKKL